MTVKLADRIRQQRITSRAVIDTAFVPRDDWDRTARHYKVTLSVPYTDRRMTVSYHMGSGLKHKPKTIEVMSGLLLDASGVAYGQSFEEWASDYGYDTDSRKAEAIYQACREQTEALRNFLLTDGDPWVMWLEQTENDY